MCLAIPGKITSIENEDPILRTGKVDFGGVIRQANLAFVPEAGVGDYVIVHVGMALSKLDEAEAMQVFDYLRQMDAAALEEELGQDAETGQSEDGSLPLLSKEGAGGRFPDAGSSPTEGNLAA